MTTEEISAVSGGASLSDPRRKDEIGGKWQELLIGYQRKMADPI